MISLRIQVEFENVKGFEQGDSRLSQDPHTTHFEALAEWWVRTVADPYMSLRPAQRLASITLSWIFLKNPISFEVAFDYNLLESLLEIYAAYGWNALEQIERRLERLPNSSVGKTKEFFRVTKNVVAVMVAQGLIDLEQQVIAYAQKKWAAARQTILDYLKAFKILEIGTKHYEIADPKVRRRLIQLCRKYALEARKASRTQEKISERYRMNLASPKEWRRKGSALDLWFEIYAAPQREILTNMVDITKHIAEIFPAALLVLDALPDSVLKADTFYHEELALNELEDLIGRTLESLGDDLQILQDSLKEPATTQQLAEVLKPMIVEPRDFSELVKLQVPPGGYEKQILDIVFKRQLAKAVGIAAAIAAIPIAAPMAALWPEHRQAPRLLANLDLLSSYYDDDESGMEPGTWDQVVLYQYFIQLKETIAEKKKDEKLWEEIWGWVGRLAALLGLLALMVLFPFGEAAAPALVSLLALCGTISVVLGVLAMIYHLFTQLQKAGKLEVEAQDKFFRLAQTDPDAVIEIGELLSQSRALRDGVISGAIITILSLATAHKLRVVAAALNFQAFFQDVETLFAPVGEVDSTAAPLAAEG
jgi:hypothetical protein